jgi:hypothetical protein
MAMSSPEPETAPMHTLAYDYPLLSVFFSIMWFFLLMAWFMALFHVLVDIFRSHDMGGFAKAIWVIFVIVLPLLGVLVYLIARGDNMTEHAIADAKKQDEMMRSYIKDTTAGNGSADELAKLAQLRDQGILSEAEFQQGKAKVLGA